MRKRSRSTLVVTGILLMLVMGCAQLPPQTGDAGDRLSARRRLVAGPAALNLYYQGTNGTVGHHMVGEPRGNCPVTWNSNDPQIVEGYLPPGLTLNRFKIVGTPQLPGTWYVKVKFSGLSCQGTSYPDQYVDVNLFIQGDAPRQVQ